MAKIFAYVIATQIMSNGFWYCAVNRDWGSQTGVFVLPVLASFFVVISFGVWIKENW